jgi:hypothetical protein
MEAFCADLEKFQKDHSWWKIEKFYSLSNTKLKKEVESIFMKNDIYMDNFFRTATGETINELMTQVRSKASLMFLSVFASILDQLYKREETGYDFSKEIVEWFREQGWEFPQFQYEKDKKIGVTITVIKG